MESTSVAVGSGTVTVRIGGPESRHTVLLLPDAGAPADVFDAVCARLHDSDLRTVVPETVDGLALVVNRADEQGSLPRLRDGRVRGESGDGKTERQHGCEQARCAHRNVRRRGVSLRQYRSRRAERQGSRLPQTC